MLAAESALSGVYYVDDHFVAYTGPKPVGKGWNDMRGRAEKGHTDTHVTTADGRAVRFVTGEPSGLTVTLPRAGEMKRPAGPGAKIMLGFDRGGAYPEVFRHCRAEGVHWVTYRRAPLAVPRCLPVLTVITTHGRPARQIAWPEETVQLKDYGQARKTARTAARAAEAALGRARADLAALVRHPAIPAPDKNTRLIHAARRKITAADRRAASAQAAVGKIPGRLPPARSTPAPRSPSCTPAAARTVTSALRLLIDEINQAPAEHARRHPPDHLPAHRQPLTFKQSAHATRPESEAGPAGG